MANVAANALVAVTGSVFVAPLGTAAPTDASTALPVAWKDLGYMNEDGVTETIERTVEDLRAWQNNDIVRSVVTEAAARFAFTAVETKKDVIETFYGGTVATNQIVINPAATGGRKAWIVHVIDGTNVERTYIADGEVTELGERNLVSTDLIGYPMTVTAYSKPIRFYALLATLLDDDQDAPIARKKAA